ncbi:acyltransferase family protein [Aeromicrobium sp.]|uniref:acyltransferase family protein n=1 Tax=Aeromicrobium sp. TaxID=1871063 RepID=UPI003C32409C
MKTLGESLDPRHNSVNAIRLAFAGSILLMHAMALGGYVKEMPKLFFHDTLATYVVAGFFVISGYLITASRVNSKSFGDYLWRRILRLYPGWIASFVLVALILGPLSLILEGRSVRGYDWSSAAGYVYKNLFFVLRQLDITGTIENVPVGRVWNFSAWTLFFEFSLWMCIGLLVLIAPKRLLNLGIVCGLVSFTAIKVYDKVTIDLSSYGTANHGRARGAVDPGLIMSVLEPMARLGAFFFAGAVLYAFRDKIKFSQIAFWICLAFAFAMAIVGWFHVVAALPFAYVVMRLGVSPKLSRVNYPNDYSYGTYIYAFPITQVLAIVNVNHHAPGWLFCLMCVLATAPVAWLSWHYLEKPAMSLKRLTAGRNKAIIGVP